MGELVRNVKYVPPLIYMILIFYLSSIPLQFPQIVDIIDPSKFMLHVIEYLILGLLMMNASGNEKFSFVVSSLYGLSDEIHQCFVPFRYFSIFDLLGDCIGSVIGVMLYPKFKHWMRKLR